jgi:hypothetical protein
MSRVRRDISQITAHRMLEALKGILSVAHAQLGWAADEHPDVNFCYDVIAEAEEDINS